MSNMRIHFARKHKKAAKLNGKNLKLVKIKRDDLMNGRLYERYEHHNDKMVRTSRQNSTMDFDETDDITINQLKV